MRVVVADRLAAPHRRPRPGARRPPRSTPRARGFDVIVVDLHPSYSRSTRPSSSEADRILVPVTPDVPAIRAAVQLRDVAARARLPRAPGDGRQPGQQRRLRRRHGAHRRDAGARPHPLRRAALREGRQRGPHGHRACSRRRRSPRTSRRSPTGCSGRQATAEPAAEGRRSGSSAAAQGSRPRLTARGRSARQRDRSVQLVPPSGARAAARGARPSAGRPGRRRAGRPVDQDHVDLGAADRLVRRVAPWRPRPGRTSPIDAVEQPVRLRARDRGRPSRRRGTAAPRGRRRRAPCGPCGRRARRRSATAASPSPARTTIRSYGSTLLRPGAGVERLRAVDRRPADVRDRRSPRAG